MAEAKKTTKKSTPKTTKKTVKKTADKMIMPETPASDQVFSRTPSASPKKSLSSKYLTIALVVIGIALLTYKLGPWLVPAIVDNRPVTRFELWQRMEAAYGQQTLDDVVNEYTLEAAIKDADIQVDRAKVEEQFQQLESQFESLGGLDEALAQRGLTREDLEKQIVTQLSVEEILKDQVQPTEEELQAYYDENGQTLFADKSFDEVKDQVETTVRDNKLREAFLEWFAKVETEVKVQNFGL